MTEIDCHLMAKALKLLDFSWRLQVPKYTDIGSQILYLQRLLGPYTMIFGYFDPNPGDPSM